MNINLNGPVKKFVFDLDRLESAKWLMACTAGFGSLAELTMRTEISDESFTEADLEQYDMNYFHSDRFKDYVWQIWEGSGVKDANGNRVSVDPSRVIFEFLHHEKLAEMLTKQELGFLKEILEEYKVEVLWH